MSSENLVAKHHACNIARHREQLFKLVVSGLLMTLNRRKSSATREFNHKAVELFTRFDP